MPAPRRKSRKHKRPIMEAAISWTIENENTAEVNRLSASSTHAFAESCMGTSPNYFQNELASENVESQVAPTEIRRMSSWKGHSKLRPLTAPAILGKAVLGSDDTPWVPTSGYAGEAGGVRSLREQRISKNDVVVGNQLKEWNQFLLCDGAQTTNTVQAEPQRTALCQKAQNSPSQLSKDLQGLLASSSSEGLRLTTQETSSVTSETQTGIQVGPGGPSSFDSESTSHSDAESPKLYCASCKSSFRRKEQDAFSRAIGKLSYCDPNLHGRDSRPRLCTNSAEKTTRTVFVYRIPSQLTFYKLEALVHAFGPVSCIEWDTGNPIAAAVSYEDPAFAEEAVHYLNDSLILSSDTQLGAELLHKDEGTQLFIGDLTADVTEKMLESKFSEFSDSHVKADLKRDARTKSHIGYGFLSFPDERSANKVLLHGHGIRIGNATARISRAERNTFLHVTELNPNLSLDDLKLVFGTFGDLVEDETTIVKRAYAFLRYRSRESAENAKRFLDQTDLSGRITVRYAEMESKKMIVHVQFYRRVYLAQLTLRDILKAAFSKYGLCSVEIPRSNSNSRRNLAFIHYHGEPFEAALAATLAIQNVQYVSNLPVLCQFARELVPFVTSKSLPQQGMDKNKLRKSNPGQGPNGMRKVCRDVQQS